MTNTINAGKVNFNVATGKAFRDIFAIWHVYDFECADVAKKYQIQIANRKGIIASDNEYLEKKNFKMHDGQYYLDDIAEHEARIAELKAEHDAWVEAQAPAVDKAKALFTKEMYKAYVASVGTPDGAWRTTAYAQAIAEFLTAQGFTPAWDTIDALYHVNGKGKGNGTSKAETKKHNKAQTENTWRAVFMGELADIMGDLLPTYKFVHILTKAAKKAAKKAAQGK